MNNKSFFILILLFCQVSLLADGFLFIENQGQFPEQVNYKAILPDGAVFLEDNQWTFNFIDRPPKHFGDHAHVHNHSHSNNECEGDEASEHCELDEKIENRWKNGRMNAHAYKMKFIGASEQTHIRPAEIQTEYHNYFIGNDESKWAGNVPLFKQVMYHQLYDCADLRVYDHDNTFKYDFIVYPEGNPNEIVVEYDGVEDIYIKNKRLHVKTSVNELIEAQPYAYQIIKGKKKKVRCQFKLTGNRVTFDFPNGWDSSTELIIDPELIFSSYSGSSADNWGFTATYDEQGNLYGGGVSFDTGYPTTNGAYDIGFNSGDCDIAISKFTSNGSNLIYSTYIGGSESEMPHSLIVNSQNQLIVMGTTSSSNYPANGWDTSFAGGPNVNISGEGIEIYLGFQDGSDIVVSVLSSDGGSMVGSTYFGGTGTDGLNDTDINGLKYNYGDVARGEVIVDGNDNIYIASCTHSSNIVGTNNLQTSKSSQQDGLVARFNPDVSQLAWFTYFGGTGDDATYSLKLHENGLLYVGGGTQSANLPATNGLNSDYIGGITDGFVVSINSNGQNFGNGTFLGTTAYDQVFFVEIDRFGDIYVVGQTQGTYSIVGNVYNNSGGKQFIHKLTPNLTTTEWSTVFGAGGKINLSLTAFLVDKCGRVYVSGWGGGINQAYNGNTGSTSGLPTTPDAHRSNTDGHDFYFFTLEKDAESLLYATFFGAESNTAEDHVDGGTSRFDKEGVIYQAVCAGCGGSDAFETTPGAWSETNGSQNCNLGVIKFNFDPNIIDAVPEAEPNAIGCAPFTINFTSAGDSGEEFLWDFGDGEISTEQNPTHIFELIDTYTVVLVVIDSAACNISDTAITMVYIPDSTKFFDPAFEYELPALCDPYIVNFTNTSDFDPTVSNLGSFDYIWDFGDGNTSTEIEPQHEYLEPGPYEVTLTMQQVPCPGEKVIAQDFVILENPFVDATFDAPEQGCIPLPVVLEAQDEAELYVWDLGDGSPIIETSEQTLEYVYDSTGNYTIELIAIDLTTCNERDTSSIDIEVFNQPEAFFTFNRDAEYILVDIEFSNLSTPDSLIYHWDFGDGDTSSVKNPVHQYTQVGDLEVCLTVTHPIGGCVDVHCEDIYVSDEFKLEKPTAFSPNGDGLNDSFSFVQIYGVKSFELQIFNRWGEQVFATTNQKDAWDGTFRGREQNVGVFMYFIEAEVAGDKLYSEKGNITLIR